MRSPRVLVLLVAILAGGVGFLAYRMTFTERLLTEATAELMRLKLPDTSGKEQPLAQWRDKVLVVNFWATWCAPCREEIPGFIQFQERFRADGVQFVGVAIDQKERVAPYAKEMGINYPLVVGGLETMEFARQLGNQRSVLPFTLVIDRSGKVASVQVGMLRPEKLESLLKPLL